MKNVEHSKTRDILRCFEEISKIPRCSKNEEKIIQWLMNWAKENSFEAKKDNVGNVVIKVPPSKGYEKSPITVIQGHLDMVCEKTPDSPHDFSKDPIKLVYDGEWLTADRTTLGSDNGIAIAMSMVIATDSESHHPPLELLFTVDEETGLTGANALAPGFIEGKLLINLDSEDEDLVFVDDEEELVATMAERLVLRGFEAEWVTSGEEALKKVEDSSYDLAVLDIKIPRISGINLKKELQKKSSAMKFIFMTGHGSEDDYQRGAAEAGSEYYLVKPVNIEILIEKMNNILKSSGVQK